VLLAILDHLLPAAEAVQERRIPPRRIDLQVGVEQICADLEADLVVAPAGRPMAHDREVQFAHLLDQSLDNRLASGAGRVPVASLVASLRLDDREADLREGLLEGHGNELVGTARPHPPPDVVEARFIRLTEIGRHADDFHAPGGEPVHDCATVQPAGCGESDAFALEIVDIHGGLRVHSFLGYPPASPV